MNLRSVARRLQRFEHSLMRSRSDQAVNRDPETDADVGAWLSQLQGLARDARCIKQKSEAAGDDRTALAAIAERRRIVELAAKLTGRIEERTVNVVRLDLSPETAERIAQIYLARHRTLEETR